MIGHRRYGRLAALALAAMLAGCVKGESGENGTSAPATPFIAMARGQVDVEGGMIRVGALREGRVRRIAAEEGDDVEAGSVLAELDAREAKVAVRVAEAGEAEAEAQVAVLRARLPQVRSQAHRTREAANAGAATGQSADETTTAVAVLQAEIAAADAAVKVARAHVEEARAGLDARAIVAPVAGRIARRAVRVGDVVSPQSADALFEILPDRPRIVRAELNESYVDKVKAGMQAEVVRDADSGAPVPARVLRVGDVFGPSRLADDSQERAGARDVECVLALEGGDFRIGQRVLVRFRR
ncbi:MAG TPA: HlyD family efflux transporter periplasmic adaptor subunit [Rhodanobacteraceae bacterium]|nr:HlyD family efflux transporter periplasmic adaptor subunit [Rhodanobacteraceae bacterium]